jgi:hypothetical protein
MHGYGSLPYLKEEEEEKELEDLLISKKIPQHHFIAFRNFRNGEEK